MFALLTDPEKILRWMGTEAQVEPQPGGLYLVNVTGARFARGSFREVVPVHRVPDSFGWEGSEAVPPGSSLVEIDLTEQPPDGTLLRLTHSGLPNAEQCAGHAEGWAHYLGRLAQFAAGRDPGPDPITGALAGVTAFPLVSPHLSSGQATGRPLRVTAARVTGLAQWPHDPAGLPMDLPAPLAWLVDKAGASPGPDRFLAGPAAGCWPTACRCPAAP